MLGSITDVGFWAEYFFIVLIFLMMKPFGVEKTGLI